MSSEAIAPATPDSELSQAQVLLEKHNPVLVIFPNDRSDLSRPGTPRILFNQQWGDYHPCSAEDFLARIIQLPTPRPFRLGDFFAQGHGPARLLCNLLGRTQEMPDPTGLQVLKHRMAGTTPAAMMVWEMDLAAIPSQDAQGAWQAYLKIIETVPQVPVVYGRLVRTTAGSALQYWYLYFYNDFKNKHEGDWEMVTIALDVDDQPTGVAVAAHHGGSYLAWSEVEKATAEGARPLVFVAKGSHAAYFHHKRGGYELIANEFVIRTHPPRYFGWLSRVIIFATNWLHWRDAPPADPLTAKDDVSKREIGIRLEPGVQVFPDGGNPDTLPADWWWMRFRGIWGSRHTRIFDSVGPDSPWAVPGAKWADPAMWVQEIIALQDIRPALPPTGPKTVRA